jgi:hypothetical protein
VMMLNVSYIYFKVEVLYFVGFLKINIAIGR